MSGFSMPENFDGLVWLLLLLGPLLFLQRRLQREVHAVLLLLTRRPTVSVALFSLLLFPGVLLHEGSHYLMARLLGVRTGRLSLIPRPMPNGRLQLGFVETASTDWIRDTLIGAAPLLTGGVFVAYAGLARLGLPTLWEGLMKDGIAGGINTLPVLYSRPDFWLWFYLTFAVSSTMLPSASDRRAWLPFSLLFAGLFGFSLLVGAGPWMLQNLTPAFNTTMRAIAIVAGITIFIHLLVLLPFWALHRLLAYLTGLDVN